MLSDFSQQKSHRFHGGLSRNRGLSLCAISGVYQYVVAFFNFIGHSFGVAYLRRVAFLMLTLQI